jgi:hypothetical protein
MNSLHPETERSSNQARWATQPLLVAGDVESLLAALRKAGIDEASLEALSSRLVASKSNPAKMAQVLDSWLVSLRVCAAHGLSEVRSSAVNKDLAPLIAAWNHMSAAPSR